MKNTIYFLTILSVMFACRPKENFTISGQLDGGEGKIIYFNKLLISNQLPSDSVKIDTKGKFSFKGRTPSPAFYELKLSKGNFIRLLIDSAENVEIRGSYKNFPHNYIVKGSIGSEALLDLDNRFTRAKTLTDSLRKLYDAHKMDPIYSTKLAEWDLQYSTLASEHTIYVTAFIKRNPFSLASVYALYQKWDEKNYVINDLQTMKTAASALFSVYPKNEHVIALYNNTLQLIQEEKNRRLAEAIKANGVNSLNIILPDADGREKSLWSLHGKYVLLHFWSAKDRASRIVNPVLSELYSKFKHKGFEIYMVSVDNDRIAWMEAIAEDNLSCINVGDMKGSFQATNNYNVQELPFNYLIDKEGNIIGRNLKGPALYQALSRLFK